MARGFQWACRSTAAGIMMPGHAGLTGLTLAGLARFGEGEGAGFAFSGAELRPAVGLFGFGVVAGDVPVRAAQEVAGVGDGVDAEVALVVLGWCAGRGRARAAAPDMLLFSFVWWWVVSSRGAAPLPEPAGSGLPPGRAPGMSPGVVIVPVAGALRHLVR